MMIRPVLMYLRKAEQNLIERTEMRMLTGIKIIEKIRNEEIRRRTGVANKSENVEIENSMRRPQIWKRQNNNNNQCRCALIVWDGKQVAACGDPARCHH